MRATLYVPVVGVDSNKEQYGADNGENHNDESPEEALVGCLTVGVNDDIALRVIFVSGGDLALPRLVLLVLHLAHADVLPHKVQYTH